MQETSVLNEKESINEGATCKLCLFNFEPAPQQNESMQSVRIWTTPSFRQHASSAPLLLCISGETDDMKDGPCGATDI